MGIFTPGLHDEEHRRAFLAAATRTWFGAIGAPVCGARTRGNGTCKMRPLAGERRCLRHAGPAAARRHHERLFEALGRGEISFEEWRQHEQRRLVNRLPRIWARNPWAPGATLDLGDFEAHFHADLALGGVNSDALSPAALDKAKWRWRRLCHDRKRPEEWLRFVRDELPKRIRRDGPRPPATAAAAAIMALFQVDGAPAPTSKRRRLDMPRVPVAAPKPQTPEGRRRTPAIDDERLAVLWHEHGATIMRVAGHDADERTIRRLLALLVRTLDDPTDAAAGEAWRCSVANCAAP